MARRKSHAPKAFIEGWSRQFSDVPAAGWLLRTAFPDRWVRFHALPGSKRYAETAAERQVILQRARQLGDTLFGQERRIWLVKHIGWFARNEVEDHRPAPGYLMPVRSGDDSPADLLCVAISRPSWPPKGFADLTIDIAEDHSRALFADLDSGRVLAPYDGGFDLISATSSERDALRETFLGWLSSHPMGL